jgi:hypothetical protein
VEREMPEVSEQEVVDVDKRRTEVAIELRS